MQMPSVHAHTHTFSRLPAAVQLEPSCRFPLGFPRVVSCSQPLNRTAASIWNGYHRTDEASPPVRPSLLNPIRRSPRAPPDQGTSSDVPSALQAALTNEFWGLGVRLRGDDGREFLPHVCQQRTGVSNVAASSAPSQEAVAAQSARVLSSSASHSPVAHPVEFQLDRESS